MRGASLGRPGQVAQDRATLSFGPGSGAAQPIFTDAAAEASASEFQQTRTTTTTHNAAAGASPLLAGSFNRAAYQQGFATSTQGVPAHLLQGAQSSVHQVLGSNAAWSQQTQVDQALLGGGAVDAQTFAADRSARAAQGYDAQLRGENESLRAEVHRLRKIEHAWRPPAGDEETRVFVVNNYQQQITQNISEINNLRSTVSSLQQENAELRGQAGGARGESALLESLRQQLRELERELQRAQAQLSEQRDRAQGQLVEEREHWSRVVEEERSERLRGRADDSQLRELQERLRMLEAELDQKLGAIAELEARLATRAPVERVFDEGGLRERDRLLEHYKLKWDELAGENRQLKALLTQGGEESVKINLRSELSSTYVADLQREREFQALLQEEARQAKEEARFYREENQRLRELVLRHVGSTEVHREVIVDRTGSYAGGLERNPQLAPTFAPGHTELISHTVVREERSSADVPARERISASPAPYTRLPAAIYAAAPSSAVYAPAPPSVVYTSAPPSAVYGQAAQRPSSVARPLAGAAFPPAKVSLSSSLSAAPIQFAQS